MNKYDLICPMFIGLQYHEHEGVKRAMSRQYLENTPGTFETRLTNTNGMSYMQYAECKETENRADRAYTFHYELEHAARLRKERINMLRRKRGDRLLAATRNALGNPQWRDESKLVGILAYDGKAAAARKVHNIGRIRTAHAETIRAALNDNEFEYSDLISALNDIHKRSTSKATDLYEKIEEESGCTLSEYIGVCSSCGLYGDADDYMEEHEGGSIGPCCRGYYHWSGFEGVLIHRRYAQQVYNSVRAQRNGDITDYCTRDYGRDHFYWSDRNYVFFTDEEDRDEADDNGDDGLADYHHADRSAFFQEVSLENTPALGVELEVHCNESRRGTVKAIRQHYSKDSLIMERDGSLDESQGFEIVTRPMGRKEWGEFGPTLLKRLRANDVVGFNAPTDEGMYGIHVNLHRRHMTPLAEARIMMFLCADENKEFVKAIAQRAEIYHPEINIGALHKADQTIRRIGGKQYDRRYEGSKGQSRYAPKIYGVGKYAPVNWKDNIAEFRIFNSTLNTGSFMKNLEFVWALLAWTKPAAATGSTWKHTDFVAWLNTPANRKEYPNLIKYLSKSSYPIVEGHDVVSSWSSLMVKPEVECHSEGCDA